MGNRRNKRVATPPLIVSKKNRQSSPPLQKPVDSKPSDILPLSDDEVLDDNQSSSSSSSSLKISEKNIPKSPSGTKISHEKTPPIIISSGDWRKAAPIVFKDQNLNPDNLIVKMHTDGNLIILTSKSANFRSVQRSLVQQKFPFITRSLPEDHTLKVVLRGIPTDISEEEITEDLTNRGFNVTTVKRFGPIDRPFPICLVILKKDSSSTKIYDLTNLFYISIKVESYKKSGPTQCFACQSFCHGTR
ncbi:uncharacterized protein LOC115033240 [Acyrthosiphon pisum]|uniref:Pre-C2HC domain-containing protein n=1 Tax=Acyrthosiphon pisum TaxID=7029 RepID=A0A8R2NK66_ACYPI|nr:uncharacterized protein LOC115033240 [Acyrthosiphon pisum]